MTHSIVPVVLCGGSGTRLWPLSSPERPKQLLPLVDERTLLEATLQRLAHLEPPVAAPVVVCNVGHELLVAAQMRAAGTASGTLVLEPVGRNSAPAVTVAALLARRAAAAGVDPLLLVLPADHVIADVAAFAAAVAVAVEPALAGYLATFGVVPTAPNTGYGYIRRGTDRGPWSVVAEFVEKPDVTTAQAYLKSGRYLWNSGMFLFAADAWLRELASHAPALLHACEAAVAAAATIDGTVRLGEAFAACPAESIDYAVMEKTARAAVVALSAGWSDVGSWSALHDVLPKDGEGNVAVGDVVLDACRDTYVAAHSRRVAAIGLEGVIIVETDDAVLVVAREHAESVKRVVQLLDAQQRRKDRGT